MTSKRALTLAAAGLALAGPLHAQRTAPVDPRVYSGLAWRNLGPFRGGRVAAVSGALGQPGVYYIGLPAAGVWKTTSAGETWYPVFDAVHEVASIGAVEVAPSDPNVIYVGTGDMITGGGINEGNGVYKSTDAGRTWTHLGLDATKQIPSLLVDPQNANAVLVAAQGDVHVKSDTRGVYRSTDGGATWTRTLFVDSTTGAQKLAWAYDTPRTVFATTVRHYTPFNPNPTRPTLPAVDAGPTGTTVYKSTDGGATWHELTGGGLPRLNGRTSIAVANHTNGQRVFLITNTGLYRSDDGGATWRQMAANDERIHNGQGGYNCGVYVDPQNPDVVYTLNTASYKSTDGGNTFTGFKGAPGGDDPQQLWIDPTNGQRMLFGYDQGAIVSLDGGGTWSSWYNQSTEQVYHIAVDASYPRWIYATQQDAGAIRTRVRGNLGAITPLDWNPVPGWEWGTIVPDPLDPSTVFASGNGLVKIHYPSEQWINVSPAVDPALHARTTSSQPLVWTPWNQHELLAGLQFVMSTVDGGVHWTRLGPDLAAAPGDTLVPGTRGAIESISASGPAPGTIWVGSSNGLIHVTRDHGRTWSDVTIPDLPNPRRAFVSSIDASRTDPATAYVAIDYHTTGDYAPYVYRTHDAGKTWTKIVDGLAVGEPSGSFARVVRADPVQRGLLFAGTESSMYVSFDDGDHWQPFALNLPNTSYRDIQFAGNDLVIGTYGRGIWVLDGYTVLRQMAPGATRLTADGVLSATHLFKPADAVRVRRNVGADTPFPPEVPHALNPLDGVLVDYVLASPAQRVTLDVLDAAGAVVRHYTSDASDSSNVPVREAARPPHPNFWVDVPHALPAGAGAHRVNWDLRYDAPPAFTHTFEINANPGLTPASPEGPLAPPGTYTLRLTVDGKAYAQTVAVRNDPRSPATAAAVAAQTALVTKLYDGIKSAWRGYQQVAALRGSVAAANATVAADYATALSAFQARLDTVGGLDAGRGGFRRPGAVTTPNFRGVVNALVSQLGAQDYADQAPTPSMLAAWGATCKELAQVETSWRALLSKDLATFNAARSRASLPALAAPTYSTTPRGC